MKRTHLPLNGLRVLDAAARHLSFTRAADELAVTPAAVGQQIRALEDMLGVVLFRRTPKGLELTQETEAGLDALRAGFLEFEEAVRAMQAGQSSSSLTIAAPRDITAKWLQKRLAAYAASQPDLKFALVAADEALDFTEANLDLALRLADGPGEHEGIRLGEATFVTVEAADGGPDGRIEWPGCPHGDKPASIRVADGGLAIEAAANGFGRAVVPLLLAEADLAAGRVRQVGDADASPLSYWLIAPLPQWRQKKVKALVEALVA
ncbi:LysR family glycine cleavage system transcriptional activator [Sphingobium wenxiniae]|jgi:LysR family glycine cleavage system transcriptional activator|uniref:LysR family glycine cleavage system transcriptional activator n=1 Tax=Sphingobium wenxiniae (strain DSM 21828 / CGMCC 1.7748 / JZ-1) TaxID=595605 RepID=A0A562KK89_SPHWJ|nr:MULTISPECIES: LysR family transcriptional regulator [Sphingobium]KMS63797.1 LysR family transcriptional regulator [Sphingobium baderi LL03]MBB6192273.1 LysR family glycine cleavage system transcriptional activator [Sphingobium wenxiniae]TWH95787.1 LysR family glycine cleavage system transcriptional activator [Sphingobium wenxiniae]